MRPTLIPLKKTAEHRSVKPCNEHKECNTPVPHFLKMIDGVREALETGMEPRELADWLGTMIDVIFGDLEAAKRERRLAAQRGVDSRSKSRGMNDTRYFGVTHPILEKNYQGASKRASDNFTNPPVRVD
jgi:hypothetical protein